VGTLDLVAELCLPFLKTGGWLLAQKSRRQAQDEVGAAEGAMRLLGGKTAAVESATAEATGRDLVVIAVEKIQPTPAQYPRHGNQLKRPLK
jgi:16S rRNA (guanine527-N7)-methyltransferase